MMGSGLWSLAVVSLLLLSAACVSAVYFESFLLDGQTGQCDNPTTFVPCALPFNANLTLGETGAGMTGGVNLSMDLYPVRNCYNSPSSDVWQCSSGMEPAIMTSMGPAGDPSAADYTTVIRLTFPPGFNTSEVRIAGANTGGVGSARVQGVYNSPNGSTACGGILLKQRDNVVPGIGLNTASPRPDQLPTLIQVSATAAPLLVTYRTGTTSLPPDSLWDSSRIVDLETVPEAESYCFPSLAVAEGVCEGDVCRCEPTPAAGCAQGCSPACIRSVGTKSYTPMTQRVTLQLEGVRVSASPGPVPSSVAIGQPVFQVQIFRFFNVANSYDPTRGRTASIPSDYLLRLFNTRINDPCALSLFPPLPPTAAVVATAPGVSSESQPAAVTCPAAVAAGRLTIMARLALLNRSVSTQTLEYDTLAQVRGWVRGCVGGCA